MRKQIFLAGVVAVGVVVALLPSRACAQQGEPSKLSAADKKRRDTASRRLGTVKVHEGRAAVVYPDRLELVDLAPGEAVDGQGNFVKGEQKRTPVQVEPRSIMWFSRSFTAKTQDGSPNLLVCTAAWTKKHGGTGADDFCGIVSFAGQIVYTFPVKQNPPNQILFPLGISQSGKYAEVYVGRLLEGEDGRTPGAPLEILIWEYPNQLRKLDGSWKKGEPKDRHAAYEEVRTGFWKRAKDR